MPLGAFKAALMGTAGVTTEGDVVLLATTTASNSATVDFTSGIDSTYWEYIFKFYDINPASDQQDFLFQVNAAGGSGFDETITSTYFYAYHAEDDSGATVSYQAGQDQAQGTSYQKICYDIGNESDESAAGELHLFNPSSTTYVKHFYSRMNVCDGAFSNDNHAAGYINTTAAIDEISFKVMSGNFDGKIKMWGVK